MFILFNLDLICWVLLFFMLMQVQVELVVDVVVKWCFKCGECIVEQGKKFNCLVIVLMGWVCVVIVDSCGCEVILVIMNLGDYVGEMSLIDNQLYLVIV